MDVKMALAAVLLAAAFAASSQGIGGGPIEPPRDELSAAARASIMAEIAANRARLISEGKLSAAYTKTITSFAWPLRQAAGRTDFNYFAIFNYIDENNLFPDQLRDYN